MDFSWNKHKCKCISSFMNDPSSRRYNYDNNFVIFLMLPQWSHEVKRFYNNGAKFSSGLVFDKWPSSKPTPKKCHFLRTLLTKNERLSNSSIKHSIKLKCIFKIFKIRTELPISCKLPIQIYHEWKIDMLSIFPWILLCSKNQFA